MGSMLEEAAQTAEPQVTKLRWSIGINGALSLALGVAIIV